MPKSKEKIVVTAALPYANGQIHIGHLLEYIQADIYTRFLKLSGQDAIYICASDMHGTPIEMNAQKAGKKPETFANEFWKDHQKDFANFLIKFDNYHKTHSDENKELAELFFNTLRKKGLINTKSMDTIYCKTDKRYLPDRFVKGICPNCSAVSQYGDVCESCNSVLKGIDLINPKCTLCGKTPIQKKSTHYFFSLSNFSKDLKKWLNSGDIQPEIKNLLKEWIDKGLDDWCISRDAPYFGFEIPGSKKETGDKKYFYVWLDAPIGYISSTMNYCQKSKKGKWEDYWKKGKSYHIIGKDIVYFHYLFWPAMLMAMDIKLPTLMTHGFITVNGAKMSKSRGTFFTAKDFLKLYPAEGLRFFYASHLDRKVVDIDLNLDEFKAVNNNVLMGSLGNYCYRVLTFAQKNYGSVGQIASEKKLVQECVELQKKIRESYSRFDFKSAVKDIIKLADIGNAYFQNSEVWKNKDSDLSKQKVAWCVNLARDLAILVAPILPEFSLKIMKSLGEKEFSWDGLNDVWKGKVAKVEKLVEKIEKEPESLKFALEMRVGKIVDVKNHPNADSLYVMQVDLGKKFGKKQVVAGLKKYLDKGQILGREVVFCTNIKPTKIRGEKSEIMILAPDDGVHVSLIDFKKTKWGDEVKFSGLDFSGKEVSFDDFLKIDMRVKDGGVFFEGKKLSSKLEDAIVSGVQDGAKVR